MRSIERLIVITILYNNVWSGRLGSNQRPIGYEPTALTPELRPEHGLL